MYNETDHTSNEGRVSHHPMNGITRGLKALAKPASIIFPSMSLVIMALVLLQFRFYIPEAGVAFAVVFYAFSALYLACLFISKVWLPGLIALLAMPAIVFFIGVNMYWPIIIAVLPAIYKVFRERERLLAARIITFGLAGVLLVTFIPSSILSCKAYNSDYHPSVQIVSPDGRHMLQISVDLEAPLGGPGKAVLYERYPFALERAEKTIFYADWIGVSNVSGAHSGDINVDVDAQWADNGSVLINGHTVDVHHTPLLFLDTDLVEYAQAQPIAPTLPPVSSIMTPSPTPGIFLDSGVQQDDWNYKSRELNIHIEKTYKYETTLYIVDVHTASMANLLTAFSHDAYDRGEERTSVMAKRQNAVLAVNGDYHGFRSTGVIIRNGTLYRDRPKEDIAVIYTDGAMDTFGPKETGGQELLAKGAWQTFSFGPALVKGGQVLEKFNVPESIQTVNPRTAIGQVEPDHFIIIVADGRNDTGDSGISMDDLAKEFIQRGCRSAYNLDGGGSCSLYFMGRIVNTPCYGKERPLSDILYFKDR